MSDVDKSSATPHTEDTSGPQTSDMPGVEPVLVAAMDDEPTTAGVGKPASEIVGRSPMQLAWLRLKRDRTAKITGALIVLMLLAAYGAPLWALVYGYDAYDQNPDKLDGSAARLPDGRVLVAGGGPGAELLDPRRSVATAVPAVADGIASSGTTSVVGSAVWFVGGYDDRVNLTGRDLRLPLAAL